MRASNECTRLILQQGPSMFLVTEAAVALTRRANPRETEVAECAADRHSQTQVEVESHEDKHQRKTDPQLDEM